MAKQKQEKQNIKRETSSVVETVATRGGNFEGTVVKKFPKRVVVEFERTVFVKKYERFYRKKTKLHARLPDNLTNDVNVGDYIFIRECRPLSKIIHFVVIKKIRDADEFTKQKLATENQDKAELLKSKEKKDKTEVKEKKK